MALGGPSRLVKGAGRALRGGRKPPVRSLLPKEIDQAVKGLGPDEPAVRASLEHGFASYLEQTEPARKSRNFSGAMTVVAIAFVRPLVLRYSRRLARRDLRDGRHGVQRPP